MAQRFDPRKLQREMQAAQRKAEAQVKREVDRVNRENQRRVDQHNRKVDRHNKKVVGDYNRHVAQVNAQNRATITALNRDLRRSAGGPRYTVTEQDLADRVQHAIAAQDERDWDVFLSYAQIDGATSATALCTALESLGVLVWFDDIAITPGRSQALQMDKGLRKARAGVVLLTSAYLVGRFWTERELGALLHKDVLIPVLDGVTFEQVKQYSGILPDLAGFETARDSVDVIAQKIAAAVVTTA